MNCPRCRHSHSQQLTFVFKHNKQKVELVAATCNKCGNLFAEDKALLKAARKHLKLLTDERLNTN